MVLQAYALACARGFLAVHAAGCITATPGEGAVHPHASAPSESWHLQSVNACNMLNPTAPFTERNMGTVPCAHAYDRLSIVFVGAAASTAIPNSDVVVWVSRARPASGISMLCLWQAVCGSVAFGTGASKTGRRGGAKSGGTCEPLEHAMQSTSQRAPHGYRWFEALSISVGHTAPSSPRVQCLEMPRLTDQVTFGVALLTPSKVMGMTARGGGARHTVWAACICFMSTILAHSIALLGHQSLWDAHRLRSKVTNQPLPPSGAALPLCCPSPHQSHSCCKSVARTVCIYLNWGVCSAVPPPAHHGPGQEIDSKTAEASGPGLFLVERTPYTRGAGGCLPFSKWWVPPSDGPIVG
uniref:Uncharacterized protein n=1 Tax=Eutreptiella gymnastica TaxID=73025 RepID=A0A6T2AHH0_9EUGL